VYGREDEFLQRVAAFARDGVAAGEATMVLAAPERLRALRRELGAGAPVDWIPNPLSELRVGIAFDDVRRHLAGRVASGRVRIAADWDLGPRSASERRGFMRWEAAATALLADREATLLCCHDGNDQALAADARATHPEVWREGEWVTDASYRPPGEHLRACPAPPPPPGEAIPLADPWALAPLRDRIAAIGEREGIDSGVLADFEIAANEVAANALWHARGPRETRVAMVDGALVCEVHDGGPGLDPLAAHTPPTPGGGGGRGLWIAHQLADVVQVIPDGGGTRVRLEVAVPPAAPASDPVRRARRSGGEGDLGGGP
jgi:anti-sigma regulatory factor (Ser/Thr protein kinase)